MMYFIIPFHFVICLAIFIQLFIIVTQLRIVTMMTYIIIRLLCLAVTKDLQLDIQTVVDIKIHRKCVHKYTIEYSDKTQIKNELQVTDSYVTHRGEMSF